MATYIPYETIVEYYNTEHKPVRTVKHQPLHDFNEVITYAVNPKEKDVVVKEVVITADNLQRNEYTGKIKTTMEPNRTEVLTTDSEDQLFSKVTTTLMKTGWERISEYPRDVIVKEIERYITRMRDGHKCMITEHDTMKFDKHYPEKVIIHGASREITETTRVPDDARGIVTEHRMISGSRIIGNPEQIDAERMEIRSSANIYNKASSYTETILDAMYGRKLVEYEMKPSINDLMPYRYSYYAWLKFHDQCMARMSYENMLKSFFEDKSPEIKHDAIFDPELFQIDWSDVTHMSMRVTNSCIPGGAIPKLTCIEIGCDECINITVTLSYDNDDRLSWRRASKVDIAIQKLIHCGPGDYGAYRTVTEKYHYTPAWEEGDVRTFTHLEDIAFCIERISKEQREKILDNAKHDNTISKIIDSLHLKLEC